jgi:hypothetical protein
MRHAGQRAVWSRLGSGISTVCRDVKGRTQDKTCDVAVNVSVGKVQVVRVEEESCDRRVGLGMRFRVGGTKE